MKSFLLIKVNVSLNGYHFSRMLAARPPKVADVTVEGTEGTASYSDKALALFSVALAGRHGYAREPSVVTRLDAL